jgi:hypothetical protein
MSFQHLKDRDVDYWEHFQQAMRISGSLISAGFKCAVHAVWPDVWETSASDTVRELSAHFKAEEGKVAEKLLAERFSEKDTLCGDDQLP